MLKEKENWTDLCSYKPMKIWFKKKTQLWGFHFEIFLFQMKCHKGFRVLRFFFQKKSFFYDWRHVNWWNPLLSDLFLGTCSFIATHNMYYKIEQWRHTVVSIHQYSSSSSSRLCVWTTNIQTHWALLSPEWHLSVMYLHRWDGSLPAQALPLCCMFSPHHTGLLPDLWRSVS